jgi:hypothetical protein
VVKEDDFGLRIEDVGCGLGDLGFQILGILVHFRHFRHLGLGIAELLKLR